MNRKWELATILAVASMLAAGASHAVARWLGIRVQSAEVLQMVPETGKRGLAVGGSSLVYYGIGWQEIATKLGVGVQNNSAPSASPCEIEFTPLGTSAAQLRVLGISLYELNETNVSDARPALVPFAQTLTDLRASSVPWSFMKSLISRYPREEVRQIFPTVGRSVHVMVGLRRKIKELLHKSAEAVQSVQSSSEQDARLTDWEEGRILRNAATMSAVLDHQQLFDGPKRRALTRIIATATPERPLLVLVLPVSPTYSRLVADPDAQAACYKMLAETLSPRPGLAVLRLDELPALRDDAVFCDLIHLNFAGRALATPLVEAQVRTWFSER